MIGSHLPALGCLQWAHSAATTLCQSPQAQDMGRRGFHVSLQCSSIEPRGNAIFPGSRPPSGEAATWDRDGVEATASSTVWRGEDGGGGPRRLESSWC